MKKSRFSDAQIVSIPIEAENLVPVAELCRAQGMSSAAFYQWRSKFGGLDASMISAMKQLQVERARLKRMYADIAIQNELIKEARAKKSQGRPLWAALIWQGFPRRNPSSKTVFSYELLWCF